MRHIRILQILLLLVLIPFVVAIVLTFRPPPPLHREPPAAGPPGPRAEGIEYLELSGQTRPLYLRAEEVTQTAEGSLRLRSVRRLEIQRSQGPPLVVQAGGGTVEGKPGARRIRLEEGVQVEDAGEGWRVRVDALVVDEAVGEARSEGGVRFEGEGVRGEARELVYGLEGQPTRLYQIQAVAGDGSRLFADEARLIREERKAILSGSVLVEQGDDRLQCRELTLSRSESGRLKAAEARGEVRAFARSPQGEPVRLTARSARARWDDTGRLAALEVRDTARVRQGSRSLAAPAIQARRRTGAGDRWDVTAEGGVTASAPGPEGRPARLEARRVEGQLDGQGEILQGMAEGEVRYESPETVAEAARMELRPTPVGRLVVLASATDPATRARLVRGRSRVAARRITTNERGTYLLAEDQVEAGLLPRAGGARPAGLFRRDQAVHFIAARLEGDPSRPHFVLEGNVRGWQGERNLAASRVEVDEPRSRLSARGKVSTRLPRTPTPSAGGAFDYVQVFSETLDYDGTQGLAVFTEEVRLELAEGWLQGERLEVLLDPDTGAVAEVRASGSLTFEFQGPARPEAEAPPPTRGAGDRLVYTPAEGRVVVYGDQGPAELRRDGPGGGTTHGRVLRYDLGSGDIEVESGTRDRAKIRTGPGS